jgi:CheY-like chemotaxis protein
MTHGQPGSSRAPSEANHAATAVSILAVDDLPANLLALEAIVEALGHELVGARSGLEALEIASTREFAAIVLDVAMPGIDGLETLKRLRDTATASATPVILLTAHRFAPEKLQRAYELGAVDYLEKPVATEVLKGKLAAFIALFAQRKHIERQAQLIRMKDRHMSILAHDLVAPLATVCAGAHQLDRHQDLAVRIVAERIGRCGRELGQLTADLIASARDATSIPLKPSVVDMSTLVEELVDDFRATYRTIRFATALSSHARGNWDPARLRQALSNVLSVAVAAGAGFAGLETRCTQDQASIIIDTDAVLQSVPPSASGDASGNSSELDPSELGLGIVVAREIAVAHGGELRAQRLRNRTRLVLILPLAKPAGSHTRAADPAQQA